MSELDRIEVRRSYNYGTKKPDRVYAVVAFGKDGEAVELPITGYEYSGAAFNLGEVKLSFNGSQVVFTVDEPCE